VLLDAWLDVVAAAGYRGRVSSDDPDGPAAEPLTDDDRQAIRERLEKQLDELRAQLDLLKTSSAPVSLDLAIGRVSRVDAMQQQQMAHATRRRVEIELRQVGGALRRIQGTSYGECALCGGDIGRRRLLARPATPYCRYCEEEGDRR
jgi:DnaK suppressor protein